MVGDLCEKLRGDLEGAGGQRGLDRAGPGPGGLADLLGRIVAAERLASAGAGEAVVDGERLLGLLQTSFGPRAEIVWGPAGAPLSAAGVALAPPLLAQLLTELSGLLSGRPWAQLTLELSPGREGLQLLFRAEGAQLRGEEVALSPALERQRAWWALAGGRLEGGGGDRILRLLLPLRGVEGPPEGARPLPVAAEPLGHQERASILVVDDDENLRTVLAAALGGRWQVRTAASAEEALALVKGAPPELVLADVMMPGMDGFTLCQRLRATPETADIVVILLTGQTSVGDRVAGFRAGADDYVLKPFATEELVSRIAVRLELRRAKAQLRQYAASLEHLVDRQVDALRARNQELEQANDELEDLVAMVSHDLKSPLVSILGYGQLLSEAYEGGDPEPAEGGHLAERIVSNASWMRSLIDRLLHFSRMRSETGAPKAFALGALSGSLRARFEERLDACAGQLDFEGAQDAVWVPRSRFEEALANLVENALKYPHPQRAPRVQVSSARRGRWVEVRVSDNCRGIPEAEWERVFRPMHRLDGDPQGGAGLGLYLVRRLTQQLGGDCWLTSVEGEGTTVTLRVPAVEGTR